MTKSKFTVEEKLKALARWDAGEKPSYIERELGLSTGYIYHWRNLRKGGRLKTENETNAVATKAPVEQASKGEIPERYKISRGEQRRYTEDFKKYLRTRVSNGELPADLCKEFGIVPSVMYVLISGAYKTKKTEPKQGMAQSNSVLTTLLHFCPHCGVPLTAFMKAAAATAQAAQTH